MLGTLSVTSFAGNLVPSNLPGGILQCSNFTMWKRYHGTLCHLTLCRDHFARWPLCQLTTLIMDNLPIDHFASWQLASWPFASGSFCQLNILLVENFASWPFYHVVSVLKVFLFGEMFIVYVISLDYKQN